MGGVTSVIRGAFSQWANTIDWTVRCDWLQDASAVTCSLQVVSFNLDRNCDGSFSIEMLRRVWADPAGTAGYIRFSGAAVFCSRRRRRHLATQRVVSVADPGHTRREDRTERDHVGPAGLRRLRHELRRSARRTFHQVSTHRSVNG